MKFRTAIVLSILITFAYAYISRALGCTSQHDISCIGFGTLFYLSAPHITGSGFFSGGGPIYGMGLGYVNKKTPKIAWKILGVVLWTFGTLFLLNDLLGWDK